MGQWLGADFSVVDVHFQLWMVLVTGILLSGFLSFGPSATFAKGGLNSNCRYFQGLF